VIEQVITSIVFIILNLSIYNLVNGNGEKKRKEDFIPSLSPNYLFSQLFQ